MKYRETQVNLHAIYILRNRSFPLFFIAQSLAVTGSWMQVTALGWLLYRLSSSPYLVANLIVLNQLPVLILFPWAGLLADRFPRRKLLIFTQISSFLVTAILAIVTLLPNPAIGTLLALVGLGGTIYAIDLPTRQAFLCDLVGSSRVRGAVILSSVSFHMARAIGPLLAGFLIAQTNEGWCIVLNSVSFLALACVLWFARLEVAQTPRFNPERANILEGLRYVQASPTLARIFLLLCTVSVLGAQHSTFIPVLVRENLHAGAKVLGVLMSAPGLGALVAAMLLLFRPGGLPLNRQLPLMSAGAGISLAVLGRSNSPWSAEVLLVFLGFCITFQNAASNILLQENTPEWIRGRMMALFSGAFMGLIPVGAFILGSATRAARVESVLTFTGLSCAILAIAIESIFSSQTTALAEK